MARNSPRKHHYVPKALINFFRFNETQVFFFERDKGIIETRNPQSIFYGKHLFSRVDEHGRKHPEIERRFGREIDNDIYKFVSRRLSPAANNIDRSITKEERLFFQRLLINLIIRPPETHEYLFRMPLARIALKINHLSEVVRLGRAKASRRRSASKSTFIQEIIGSAHDIHAHYLSRHGIYFLYPDEGSRDFILGANPVIRNFLTKRQGNQHPEGPTKNRTEYFLPLAPSLGILFSGNVSDNSIYIINDAQVAALNNAAYRLSPAIVSRSAELIKETVASAS